METALESLLVPTKSTEKFSRKAPLMVQNLLIPSIKSSTATFQPLGSSISDVLLT